MKTYTNIKEVNKDIVNGVLRVEDDIHITFNECKIEADIVCRNIDARNIDALNIEALNITARNIEALDIDARNIDALNIDARNITARDIDILDITAHNIDAHNITAHDVNADDITAHDVNARNVNYFAVCFAYENIICDSIEGRRGNSKHFCLDGEITIREPETIEVLGKTYNKKDVEERLRELQETANKQL